MRVRLFALLSAVALCFVAAIPASAASEGHSYLALGDSVPFGFNPNPAAWSSINTLVGYPEIVAQRLNIEEVNAACPGEATGGFITVGGADNGCHTMWLPSGGPMHVTYTGTQLAFATSYLTTHPRTRLVTLMLGANDAFLLQHFCEATNPTPAGIAACEASGLPGVLGTIRANLTTIFAALRATGYTGLIIGVTYYAVDYTNTTGVTVTAALNQTMTSAGSGFDVHIASGFDAFLAGSAAFGGQPCLAGLLLPKFPPAAGCDVHPTPSGRDLLAGAVIDAIAGTCPAPDVTGCLNRA